MNETVFFTSLLLAAANDGDAHMTGTAHVFNVSKTGTRNGSHLFRIAIPFAGRQAPCQARPARQRPQSAASAPRRGAIRHTFDNPVILTGTAAPPCNFPGNV
ncbi:hypothetical protein PUN4_490096 [Paraburkholderia unamae]|nr:hypothetical protein PUN4_490096 [Paraburkholderia unamae]